MLISTTACIALRSNQCFLLAGFQWDYVFDWTILKYQQTQQAQTLVQPARAGASREREARESDQGGTGGATYGGAATRPMVRGDSGRR